MIGIGTGVWIRKLQEKSQDKWPFNVCSANEHIHSKSTFTLLTGATYDLPKREASDWLAASPSEKAKKCLGNCWGIHAFHFPQFIVQYAHLSMWSQHSWADRKTWEGTQGDACKVKTARHRWMGGRTSPWTNERWREVGNWWNWNIVNGEQVWRESDDSARPLFYHLDFHNMNVLARI